MNKLNENLDATQSPEVGRRNFLRYASIGVAGAVGAMAATAGPASAEDLTIPHKGQPADIKAPKGLGRRAMLDQRFPTTYSQSVPQGVSILTQWFVALQERN